MNKPAYHILNGVIGFIINEAIALVCHALGIPLWKCFNLYTGVGILLIELFYAQSLVARND